MKIDAQHAIAHNKVMIIDGALILHRYRVMKKIDEVCLKSGIDLRSMVCEQEKLGEAAFIIYNLKRALRYKFAKSWGAKDLQEVLIICKQIIDLAKLNTTNQKPALLGMI